MVVVGSAGWRIHDLTAVVVGREKIVLAVFEMHAAGHKDSLEEVCLCLEAVEVLATVAQELVSIAGPKG